MLYEPLLTNGIMLLCGTVQRQEIATNPMCTASIMFQDQAGIRVQSDMGFLL